MNDILKTLDEHGFQYIQKGTLDGSMVLTNGCFDILHKGHVECLEYAKSLGGFLTVAINDDEGIRRLKGEGRPVIALEDRMYVLATLRCVDLVVVFHGTRATDLFRILRPSIYVKGGDYSIESLDKGEKDALLYENPDMRFEFFKFRTQISTSGIIRKIKGE